MDRADSDVLLVLCNAPDEDTAEEIAFELIDSGAAACVNILGACRSVYRWEGKTEDGEERPLLIKTVRGRLKEVQETVLGLHPDEVPEVIAVPVTGGSPSYLAFVRESCKRD